MSSDLPFTGSFAMGYCYAIRLMFSSSLLGFMLSKRLIVRVVLSMVLLREQSCRADMYYYWYDYGVQREDQKLHGTICTSIASQRTDGEGFDMMLSSMTGPTTTMLST